jgi:hypothetical protein
MQVVLFQGNNIQTIFARIPPKAENLFLKLPRPSGGGKKKLFQK